MPAPAPKPIRATLPCGTLRVRPWRAVGNGYAVTERGSTTLTNKSKCSASPQGVAPTEIPVQTIDLEK